MTTPDLDALAGSVPAPDSSSQLHRRFPTGGRANTTLINPMAVSAWSRQDVTISMISNQYIPPPPSEEPAHLSLLKLLEDRYPHLAARVDILESKARHHGYSPFEAARLEALVSAAPPWSTRLFEKRDSEFVSRVCEANPEMRAANTDGYSLEHAAQDCAQLAWELDFIFPESEFPDVAAAARVKDVNSLSDKLQRKQETNPHYVLADVPDTVAGRVDTPDLATLGEATHRIEEAYGPRILAKLDYFSQPATNGYRAIHYIVDYDRRAVEIQVTTRNCRTADLATHDTLYKNRDSQLPPDHGDQFRKLAAMAMMVDAKEWLEESQGLKAQDPPGTGGPVS